MSGMYDVVVGFDLGHSAIKMTFDGADHTVKRLLVPSLACSAMTIRNEAEARNAEKETVIVRGKPWFVGETAAIQGLNVLATGLSPDWVSSSEHAALLTYGKRVIDEQAPSGARLFVLGLPVDQFSPNYKEQLRETACDILDVESPERILILPQPMGAYYAHLFDRNGLPKADTSIKDQSWAMIDVGYFSTDIVLLNKGRWAEKASGGCAGVQMAADSVRRALADRDINIDMTEAQSVLRTKTVKDYRGMISAEKEVDTALTDLAAQVWDTSSKLLGSSARSLEGVLVVGGGAEIVLPTLQAQWPHAQSVEDSYPKARLSGPRFVVSEGFYRAGRSQSQLRSRKRQTRD